MALPVGTPAPDMTLRSKQGDQVVDVTLSEEWAKGPLLLLFFPAAFTGVCGKEFCDKSEATSFRSLGINAYGISVDTFYAQAAWIKELGIETPLLSDFAHKATKAYDVVLPDLSGIGPASARATFIIDKDGIIRYSAQTEKSGDSRDFEALEAAVKAII